MAFDGRGMLALLAALAIPALAGTAPPPQPKLELTLLDGTHFDLAAMRGRIVVVNFWATWCVPCRAEMPLLDRFARAHPAVTMIGVSMDQRRDVGVVRRVMAGLQYGAGLASTAKVNDFGEPRELPVTYLIDRQGRIAARFTGGKPPLTETLLDGALAAAP